MQEKLTMTVYPNNLPPVPYSDQELFQLALKYESVTGVTPKWLLKDLLSVINEKFSDAEILMETGIDAIEATLWEDERKEDLKWGWGDGQYEIREIFISSLFEELVVNRRYTPIRDIKQTILHLIKNS